MSQLTANVQRDYERGETNTLPVAASATIYQGSAVGLSSGYARQLVAGDVFKGFAEAKADNSAGSAGDVKVQIKHSGLIYLAVDSVAITDEGKAVYASDGATFTLTQSTNTRVGTVHRFVSTGYAIVKFNADAAGDLSGITALTDSTGGSANNTLAAITLPTTLTVADGAGTNDGTIGAITADASVIAAVQELAAGVNASRTAINVIRDGLADLAAKQNEVIAALK